MSQAKTPTQQASQAWSGRKRWSWFLGQETGIYKWETALD